MNVKKKFLIGYAAAAVIALLAFEYAFWSNGFSYLEKQSEAGYLTQAEMLRDILLAELQGDADLAASSEAFAGRYGEKYQIRITIIDKDGNVLGESDGPGPAMSNHLDREEVRKALAGESNSMIRYLWPGLLLLCGSIEKRGIPGRDPHGCSYGRAAEHGR